MRMLSFVIWLRRIIFTITKICHQIRWLFFVGEDSRIKLKMAGQKVKFDTILLASIVDRLSLLVWAKTKDGQNGRNKPKSIVDGINKPVQEKEEVVFATSEEFEEVRNKILREGG